MVLHILGSSSSGNGYILSNGRETLIIECGMKLIEVKKALAFNLSSVKGALVSHRHGDHAKYVKEYAEAGIPVLTSTDVAEACGLKLTIMEPPKGYRVGGFSVVPFPVNHDVPCLGFVISHIDSGNILFLTDTFMCEYTFPNLNHVIVEANYADDILQASINKGGTHGAMRGRLLTSHMEVETTKGILAANDLNGVINIVLCHLSNGHSDERRFINEVKELTGKSNVWAAKSNMQVNFSRSPF
jgi:phosphoribosyl 1,2-cyclic phosphodiesterase